MKGKKWGEFATAIAKLCCYCFSPKIMRFQNGSNKVAIELRVVQFWSEIILVISNRTRATRSFDFEIARMISDQIALHSVQLPLLICKISNFCLTVLVFSLFSFDSNNEVDFSFLYCRHVDFVYIYSAEVPGLLAPDSFANFIFCVFFRLTDLKSENAFDNKRKKAYGLIITARDSSASVLKQTALPNYTKSCCKTKFYYSRFSHFYPLYPG